MDAGIHTVREFPVARETLFAAFADPAILATWWGPHGSVNAFHAFDLRPGGSWRFTMRAADGAEYAMAHEFRDVIAPERIVMRHLQSGHAFELAMRYDAIGPARSRLSWRMLFDDPAEEARVSHFVTEANEQNFDRLEAALGLPTGRRNAHDGTETGP